MMKKKQIFILLLSMMTMLTGCGNSYKSSELKVSLAKEEPVQEEEISEESVIKLNTFGLDLFKANEDDRNPVLSPLSAYLALHMVAEGADEKTKDEFEALMGSVEEQKVIAAIAKKELPSNTSDMIFTIADSAWIDDDFHVNKEWLENVIADKQDKAFQLNLSTEDAMNQMNQWVKDSTDGMIEKMITDPLPDSTRLVLFDALFMKGKWNTPFKKEDTQMEDFYLSADQTIQVSMMNQYDEAYAYLENDWLEGCILPYKNSSFAFVACKPKNQDTDIRTALDRLSATELLELVQTGQEKQLNLKLPSFEIAYEKTLNNSLMQLGLVDVFDPEKANLSKMGTTTTNNPIYVDLVYQKAKVNVDEEGTKAAAVTEVAMLEATAYIEPEEVYDLYFNQPFFYMILDTKNQIPVFMGIIDQP